MVKKKATQKSARTRSQKAKASVEKGAKFEEMVADLYRLLGAKVTQNIEICQKKVDVFAVFTVPGSPIPHRVIVECKDEKTARAQNQRVMQFKGLLDVARKAGEADSAEIITRVPWSDAAKGFALKSGVGLLTYEEKIAQLIDLKEYLMDLVDRFDKGDPQRPSEPPVGKYYVDLSAERRTEKGIIKLPVVDEYVHQWLRRDEAPHLALLGGYGTGKTCLGQKLAHDLAAAYLKARGSGRIPILFNLREFTKTLKLESLVTSFLDEECGVMNPRFKLFQAMNEAGIFLLIFDGFDEMAVRVDVDTLEINLQEIEKLAASPKSKVIITSRTEYFVSGEEEKRAFYPKGELLATREVEYEPVTICAWDEGQVNSFLKKRVPLIEGGKQRWTYYRDRIGRISGLADLSRRPVLLDMIVRTLPQLVASGKAISRPNLYETYLMGEIKRQKILKKRKLLLSEGTRFSLLQRLAVNFYGGQIAQIGFDDAQKYLRRLVKPHKSELEVYTRDFLTCSFLIREGDHYRFSHRSIMEYLAATALIEEVKKDDPRAFWTQRLDRVVADFLAELGPPTDTLWRWLESTRLRGVEDIRFLGGNAASVICRLDSTALRDKNLSRANLRGAHLVGADLRNTDFTGANLTGTTLSYAKFLRKDLDSARVAGVRVTLLCLGELSRKMAARATDDREKGKENVWHAFVRQIRHHLAQLGAQRSSCVFANFGALHVVGVVFVTVPNVRFLRLLPPNLDTRPVRLVKAALYWDEVESLRFMIPDDLTKEFDSLIHEAERFS